MLYVNGEILDVNNKKEDYSLKEEVKEFHTRVNHLSETFGKVIRIVSKRESRVDPVTKRLITVPTLGLSMQNVVIENGQRKEWVFSDTPLAKINGKLKIERPVYIIKNNGELYLDLKSEVELAYFILFKSDQCSIDENDNKEFRVYNKKKLNQNTANDRRKLAKLGDVVYDKLSESEVRLLAKRYGLGGVDNLTGDEIRNALYEKILNNEGMKVKGDASVTGIDEFIKDSNIDLKIQLGALIQDAIDQGTLVFNERERRWDLDYKDDRTPYSLMEVNLNELKRPQESLLSYLLSDETALERLKGVLGDRGKIVEEITNDMIESTSKTPVLRGYARKLLNWSPPNTMTAKELKEEIFTRLKAKQNV
jgi:hypothetical protein